MNVNVWKCEEQGSVVHVLLWIFPIIALPCIGTPASVPLTPGQHLVHPGHRPRELGLEFCPAIGQLCDPGSY